MKSDFIIFVFVQILGILIKFAFILCFVVSF